MTVENSFEDKRSDETLGAFLMRVRESHHLTVDQLVSTVRISKSFLQAIEKSDWNFFPVEAYVRGYLNTLCHKYGLDTKAVLEIYLAERNGVQPNSSLKTILPPEEKKPAPIKVEVKPAVSNNPMTAEPKKEPIVIKVEPPKFVAKTEMPSPVNAAPANFASKEPAPIAAPLSKEQLKTPVFEEDSPKKSNAVIIVVAVLFVIACIVAVIFMNNKGLISVKTNEAAAPVVAQDSVVENTEMPEGAIKADSAVVAVAQAPTKARLTQAEVDEALKKSGQPASATIFISSSSKKEKATAEIAPVSDHGKTRVELFASGKMTSWVGMRYDYDSDEFDKEANLESYGEKMGFNAKDTLYITIGEPRAVLKMTLNGVETPIPVAKFGRVVRFRVYDGRVLP